MAASVQYADRRRYHDLVQAIWMNPEWRVDSSSARHGSIFINW